MAYFSDVLLGIRSTVKGLNLTLKHLLEARVNRGKEEISQDNFFDLQTGRVTLQYPHETITVPDNGRYQLENEIDDCIVCDKCAKVCPVDCIEIEAIKSPTIISHASDGSPIRLYAEKFDIDMAKCCFCGLCTTVCPTECLTMNNTYDFSVSNIADLNFEFATLSPTEAKEKKDLYEKYLKEKEQTQKPAEATAEAPKSKPIFKPKMKSPEPEEKRPKIVFSPKMPIVKPSEGAQSDPPPGKKPIFKPKLKPD